MWQELFAHFDIFLSGFAKTILISVLALLLTFAIGILVGLLRVSGKKAVKTICQGYISFFQNTPLVVQVFFFYNVLPRLGIMLSPFILGCISLGLYTGAFAASIVEAAIQAVPIGQMEAAASQGFPFLTAMRLIILPQALKIAMPPMANQSVNLIKNSSVLALIAGGELMYRSDSFAADASIYGPTFIVVGVLYLIICLPLSTYARNMEERLKKGAAK
jgi:putative glutamine transport system permease protein